MLMGSDCALLSSTPPPTTCSGTLSAADTIQLATIAIPVAAHVTGHGFATS